MALGGLKARPRFLVGQDAPLSCIEALQHALSTGLQGGKVVHRGCLEFLVFLLDNGKNFSAQGNVRL